MVRFYLFFFLVSSVPLFGLPGVKDKTEIKNFQPVRSSREENNSRDNERRDNSVAQEVTLIENNRNLMEISRNQWSQTPIEAEEEASFPSAEITFSSSSTEAAEAIFQGTPIKEDLDKTHYRLRANDEHKNEPFWEQCLKNQRKWEATDRFDNPDLGETWSVHDTEVEPVLELVGKNDNRVALIDKKRTTYQKELEELDNSEVSSSADLNRIFVLKALIPVLEKASKYQKEMITHLEGTSKKWAVKKAAISESLDAHFKINKTPNKVERVAAQLENDAHQLTLLQNRLLALKTVEAQLQRPDFRPLMTLNTEDVAKRCTSLTKLINDQKDLLSQRVAYAISLCPPYEKLDVATQNEIKKNKENCIRAETAALKKIEDTRFQSPNIEWQIALNEISEETQKPEPNEQVITWYREAADLYQQAVEAENLGQDQKAEYLKDAGRSLNEAAQAAQKPEPNEQVITWYREAANLYQQAVKARNLHEYKKAGYLKAAGSSLYEAAQEARKPEPKERVITLYREVVDLYQQVVEAKNLGQDHKAVYLNIAGWYLFEAAQEAQKLEPKEQSITLHREAVDLQRQAAEAENLGQDQKAQDLNIAGLSLFNAAQEAQYTQPKERVITWYREAADLWRQAVEAKNLGQDQKAQDLKIAGLSLFDAAKKAQNTQPN